MPGKTIEEDVKEATRRFSERFGAEAQVQLRSIEGKILLVEFSGHICRTCGLVDYFDDYALVLEEVSGTPHAVWDYERITEPEPGLIVKIVRIDFLDKMRKAIETVRELVENRIREFEKAGKGEDRIFRELCFCILTANYRAEEGIRIQEAMGESFRTLEEGELASRLKELGYRFPATRARYIAESRRLYGMLGKMLREFASAQAAREWLVRNVKGFGYKEASHFLRNTGYMDVAIIDRHILRFLADEKLVGEIPKSLNKARYLELEKLLSAVADKLDLTMGELDLYIWYMRTGKVLK